MATQVQFRRGSTAQVAAATPAAGEIVVDTDKDTVVVGDGSTAGGFELARADLNNVSDTDLNAALTGNTVSALTVTALTTAGVTTTGDISFGDNDKAIFGAGSDLQIYHDGSNSIITDQGSGTLKIQGDSAVRLESTAGERYFVGTNNGAARLYHDDSQKLSTTSTGISVSGAVGAPSSENFYRIKLRDTGGIANDVGIGQPDADSLAFNFTPTAGGHIAFFSGSNEKVRIDSSGTLLVGKTEDGVSNAGHVLFGSGAAYHIRSGGFTNFFNRTSSAGEILRFAEDGTTVGSIGSEGGDSLYIQSGTTSGSGLHFHPTSALIRPARNGATVDAVLNLGASTRRFKDLFLSGQAIAGDGSVTAPSFRGTDTNTGIFFPSAGVTAISRNGVEGCRMDASGNLLVGGTGLAQADSVGFTTEGIIYSARASGTGRSNIIFYNGSSVVGSITTSASATTYNTSSDQRLKENIADADDAGSKIDAIQVRKFDWIADGSHQDYGMVAQELQTVAPEAVSAPEDPDEMMGVDYSKLVPMLVKEIQSLRNRVAELENN